MQIVFLATRIFGNDGVSLEAGHWKEILLKMGHKVTFVAGQLDQSGILIPELHFQHPKIAELYDNVVYSKGDYRKVESGIFDIAGTIEGKIREVFHNGIYPDLLIVPNIFSIPMSFPLAVALARVIEEDKIPTIARHHDFWWERDRFNNSTMFGFFKHWFPPNIFSISHCVINSIAKEELFKRTGLKAEVIPDTYDFNSKTNQIDAFSKNFRSDFSLKKDDIIFLQPTRLVPRKRIEISVKLVKKLGNSKAVLVLAGHSGDEGYLYEKRMKKLCLKENIRYKFIGKYINSRRRYVEENKNGKTVRRRIFTLWDSYVNSDFVLYPTSCEGFGNQFIETMFFKKPILLTPYPVYLKDIKPLGFRTIEMTENVQEDVIKNINFLISSPSEVGEMVRDNFDLAKKYFDYKVVREKLNKIISTLNKK